MSEDPREKKWAADMEFLSYCEMHSQTPRCGFTPEQLARLYQMADPSKYAEEVVLYRGMPNQVVNCDPTVIRNLVAEARVH